MKQATRLPKCRPHGRRRLRLPCIDNLSRAAATCRGKEKEDAGQTHTGATHQPDGGSDLLRSLRRWLRHDSGGAWTAALRAPRAVKSVQRAKLACVQHERNTAPGLAWLCFASLCRHRLHSNALAAPRRRRPQVVRRQARRAKTCTACSTLELTHGEHCSRVAANEAQRTPRCTGGRLATLVSRTVMREERLRVAAGKMRAPAVGTTARRPDDTRRAVCLSSGAGV